MKVINQWKQNNKNDFIFIFFAIDWSPPKKYNYFIITFLNFEFKWECK